MNIICNNCGGADIYNLKKMEFNNPFIWCAVFADDMISLVEQYDKLNFKNYELIKFTEDYANKNNYDRFNPTMTGILIDNKVRIFYTHYLWGTETKPTKKGPDVFYRKNFEYAYTKFEKRLKRMLENNEEPKFLIFGYKRHGWNKNKIEKLLTINTKYKVLLITDFDVNTIKNNFSIIKEKELNGKLKLPLSVINKYKNKIFKELGI